MEKVLCGSKPVLVKENLLIKSSEMYFYQYLPIKIAGVAEYIPDQLTHLLNLINICRMDFENNNKDHREYNIYLTAKHLYVKGGCNLNREGWHCDGFLSMDTNYIWSNCLPTEFIIGEFPLSADHEKSIDEMNSYAKDSYIHKMLNNSLYKLDTKVIHRCAVNESNESVLRHFVKLSFSKEKYNLIGNSRNYGLNYDWEMKERNIERNHPTK